MTQKPLVDDYLESKCSDFSRPIVKRLREIYLSQGLHEEIKWGVPCYSHQGLICSIGAFKQHVASWFFKGVLLNDPHCVLRKAQESTRGLRSLYYTDGLQVDEQVVIQFVKEAMILNEKGAIVPSKKASPITPPDYFLEHLGKHKKALSTYEVLSASKKKEYILWITEAKRPDTRHRRLRNMIALLEEGKGLTDEYKK